MGEDAVQYKRYKVMQTMGWNIWEYNNSPQWLVDQIWAFMATEEKYFEIKRDEAKNGG